MPFYLTYFDSFILIRIITMNDHLYIPRDYYPVLDLIQTEKAIKLAKQIFEQHMENDLDLRRVTAPLFVLQGTGINDDLSGIERPVRFPIKSMREQQAEIVHSLAKWKRMTLGKLKIKEGYGIYTDMNAIRPDEILDNIHSLYVDQWDWERVIAAADRNLDFLKQMVTKLFKAIKTTELQLSEEFPALIPQLPDTITFIHSEALCEQYPDLSPREREDLAAREFGAVFIIGIGGTLKNGTKHDDRAPDYDDWTTETVNGYKGLNGDIIVWNPVLERSFELSSMGIRVDRAGLLKQLELAGCPDRAELLWHKMLLDETLPLSIGGGIGQSRLCMLFLKKAHIGEIQSSIWPDEIVQACEQNNIHLL